MPIKFGHEVGEYAKGLFPGAVEIQYDGFSHSEQIALTQEAIRNGSASICEAAFSHDSVFVKADILHSGPEGWDLYEVKGTSEVKDVHIDDVSVQYHVISGSGVQISRAFVVHVNNQYVRDGKIDPARLFSIADVTAQVIEKQPFVVAKIAELRDMLSGDMPVIDIGPHCSKPYECDFGGHCWQHIPENSVFDLRGNGADAFDLYQQGIVELKDIPLDMLNDSQRLQVESFINQTETVNGDAVAEFLDTLHYPLYFLDFETCQYAIPPHDGLSPFNQVPFQYSLHCQESPDAALTHVEFLAEPREDPRLKLVERLLADIPRNACVVTYSPFEKKRLNELAGWFPQHADRIGRIIEKLRDLATPFRRKDYYHWQLLGSYSIKNVLPALVPELSYDNMEICDGGMAMNAWHEMNEMAASGSPAELARIRRALLEYCALDTLAMARIVEKLRLLCGINSKIQAA